jgi:hypothetical protein
MEPGQPNRNVYVDSTAIIPRALPLRERTAHDLEPLKVVGIAGVFTVSGDVKRRNPKEAECELGYKRLLCVCLSIPLTPLS